jgi:hypothetical protein
MECSPEQRLKVDSIPDIEASMSAEKLDDTLRGLLSKYVSVWLWSIVFGSASGIAFSVATYRGYEKATFFAMFSLLPLLAGMVAAALSFLHLFSCLSLYLLPVFMRNEEVKPLFFETHLRKAVAYMIITLVTRLILAAFDVALVAARF